MITLLVSKVNVHNKYVLVTKEGNWGGLHYDIEDDIDDDHSVGKQGQSTKRIYALVIKTMLPR